ncbi:MAG: ferritin-like domain-containing protein [Pseudomonadota bacterium]
MPLPSACVDVPIPELRAAALEALIERDPARKVQLTRVMELAAATLPLDAEASLAEPADLPGTPSAPELRSHLDVPKRSPFTEEGLAALLHAVTHIEFNAINLALDAVWRFPGMPREYYLDWSRVAAEEAHHFSLLRGLLQVMGWDYGSFPAHTGLWDMTHRTRHDVVARMALVPRTLEARGLDATPPMQAKLRKVATPNALRAVDILDVILHDEVGHVAVGNAWYRWLCDREGLEPIEHYRFLTVQHGAPRLRPPFNESARRGAGFTEAEIADLLQASPAQPPATAPRQPSPKAL